MIRIDSTTDEFSSVIIDANISVIQEIFEWLWENQIRIYDNIDDQEIEIDRKMIETVIEAIKPWNVEPYIRISLAKNDAIKMVLAF